MRATEQLHAIKNRNDYDAAIRQKVKEGKSGEALFFELALEDLQQVMERSAGMHRIQEQGAQDRLSSWTDEMNGKSLSQRYRPKGIAMRKSQRTPQRDFR